MKNKNKLDKIVAEVRKQAYRDLTELFGHAGSDLTNMLATAENLLNEAKAKPETQVKNYISKINDFYNFFVELRDEQHIGKAIGSWQGTDYEQLKHWFGLSLSEPSKIKEQLKQIDSNLAQRYEDYTALKNDIKIEPEIVSRSIYYDRHLRPFYTQLLRALNKNTLSPIEEQDEERKVSIRNADPERIALEFTYEIPKNADHLIIGKKKFEEIKKGDIAPLATASILNLYKYHLAFNEASKGFFGFDTDYEKKDKLDKSGYDGTQKFKIYFKKLVKDKE